MYETVNSFFNENFKLFKIINSYLSFRRFCCEMSHVKAYACDYTMVDWDSMGRVITKTGV